MLTVQCSVVGTRGNDRRMNTAGAGPSLKSVKVRDGARERSRASKTVRGSDRAPQKLRTG
jgi:hypothetical protein